MRFNHRLLRSLAVWCTISVGVAGAALAQGRDKAKSRPAVLLGRVLDTTGAALGDAEVVVGLTKDTSVVRRMTSNASGDVIVTDLPAGGPYTLLARKIGYGSARGSDVYLRAGDTLRVDFELPTIGVTLPTITVSGRRNSPYMITAEQFNPKQYRDALAVVAWKRPYMLGDPDRCKAPPAPLWPVPTSTRRGRRPWVDDARFFNDFNPPYSPYIERVYVNGFRIDVPGRSPLIALHDVPSDQIAEMRYVDCTNTTDLWPYSIYVVLKSPSREVQDSIIRSITGREPSHDRSD